MRKLTNLKSLSGPIFVTGHTGFKGTWLTSLLDLLEVPWFGFSLEPEKDSLYSRIGRTQPGREIFGDIRDEGQVLSAFKRSQPSALIHLAAQPLVLRSYKEPRYTFDVNVMGTANILEAARLSSHVEYAIVATTDKVYENKEKGIAFKESDPLGGFDPYSASKAATEMVVDAWRNIHKNGSALRVSSVRAGNVIGGGDFSENRLLPDLIRGFISGETIEIRNPVSVRPWQHVLDPLIGYLSVLDFGLENFSPRAVNFGPNEKGLIVSDVVRIAQESWREPTSVEFIGKTTENHEATLLDLDSSWARKNLDWDNLYTQHEAVRSTVTWWQEVLLSKSNPREIMQKEIIQKFPGIISQ